MNAARVQTSRKLDGTSTERQGSERGKAGEGEDELEKENKEAEVKDSLEKHLE